jgi:hypothetical protein
MLRSATGCCGGLWNATGCCRWKRGLISWFGAWGRLWGSREGAAVGYRGQDKAMGCYRGLQRGPQSLRSATGRQGPSQQPMAGYRCPQLSTAGPLSHCPPRVPAAIYGMPQAATQPPRQAHSGCDLEFFELTRGGGREPPMGRKPRITKVQQREAARAAHQTTLWECPVRTLSQAPLRVCADAVGGCTELAP